MGDDTLDTGDGIADTLVAGPGDDVLEADGGGTADAGPGDDRVNAPTPPATALGVACGEGDDVGPVQRGVTIAADCEWLGFGALTEVRRRLRLQGGRARAIVRGSWKRGQRRPPARLVLRDARTGRVLDDRAFAGRGAEPSTVRLRVPRSVRRRVKRTGSAAATLGASPGGPRGPVSVVD